MLSFSDSRNFTRTLAAICLIATPILLFAAVLLAPNTSDDAGKALNQVADNKARDVIGGLLFLFAPLVLVPAMMGVIRLMRRRGVTLGQVGAALIMFGGLMTMAFYGYGVVQYIAATESGLDHAQMAKLFDAVDDSALQIPVILGFVVGLLIGSILLAIALWRNRVVPVWGPIALVISAILGFFGMNTVIGAISFALLFVGVLPIAQKLLSISDEEWEDWHLPEAGGGPAAPLAPEGTPPG